MELAQNGGLRVIRALRGDAVFVPDKAWDKPEWPSAVKVLTFLFGARQIGISLVQYKEASENSVNVINTNVHGRYDGLTHDILGALMLFASHPSQGPLSRLLVESLLHSCLRLLKTPTKDPSRKAVLSYESICLFVQENFQTSLTRQTVAEHFELAPNHVSRLFRLEGQMRFHDYLNIVRMNRRNSCCAITE